jgi:hypothetical protein
MERVKNRGARIAALAAAIGIFVMAPAGAAGAKISPASCSNNGGNEPAGQQPSCTGSGLTQNPAKNPAGNAPPGQQP